MKDAEKIRGILSAFCDLLIEKEPEVKSIRIKAEMNNKSKISFKRFREYK